MYHAGDAPAITNFVCQHAPRRSELMAFCMPYWEVLPRQLPTGQGLGAALPLTSVRSWVETTLTSLLALVIRRPFSWTTGPSSENFRESFTKVSELCWPASAASKNIT